MSALADFPVTRKWPPRHPEQLQLYSLPTPNGVKVSVMLEETGLAYEPHLVNFDTNDQLSPEFRVAESLRQDPGDPGSERPRAADRSRCSSPARSSSTSPTRAGSSCRARAGARYQTIQWLMFQMGGIGPMFGQVGFFHKFAGKDFEDKRPRDRYVTEARRLLGVLNERLTGRTWLMGDNYTIADMAAFPWVRNLVGFYEAGELVRFSEFPRVAATLERFVARPAVARALLIPKRD